MGHFPSLSNFFPSFSPLHFKQVLQKESHSHFLNGTEICCSPLLFTLHQKRMQKVQAKQGGKSLLSKKEQDWIQLYLHSVLHPDNNIGGGVASLHSCVPRLLCISRVLAQLSAINYTERVPSRSVLLR